MEGGRNLDGFSIAEDCLLVGWGSPAIGYCGEVRGVGKGVGCYGAGYFAGFGSGWERE